MKGRSIRARTSPSLVTAPILTAVPPMSMPSLISVYLHLDGEVGGQAGIAHGFRLHAASNGQVNRKPLEGDDRVQDVENALFIRLQPDPILIRRSIRQVQKERL